MNKYINIKERGRISISYLSLTLIGEEKEQDLNLYEKVNTYLMKNQKKELNAPKKKESISEIKIIEIHRNEHFGDALLFLNEKSPLVLKVKSKVSELLVLRKMEAIEIYSIYPNIWNRINRKSIYNLEQIKKRIKKELYLVSKRYGKTQVENMLRKTRTIKRYINFVNCENTKDKNKNQEKNENKEKNKNEENSENTEENKSKKNSENTEESEKKDNNENKISEKEEDKNNEECSSKEKEDKSYKKSNNKSDIKNEKNSEKNKPKPLSNKSVNKMKIAIKTPDLIDKKSIKSKSNEKELIINSLETSDAVKSKIKENDKTKPNELIINIFSSNINKSQKNSNKFLKIRNNIKDNFKKSNFTSKLKIDDKSNRGENDNYSYLEYDNKSRISNIKREKEEFVFNSFSNLSKVNEKSFHIKSLYENLNKISNNKYGSSSELQMKIRDILINEHSLIHSFSKINYFSRGHKRKSQLYANKILSKFSTVKDIKNFFDQEEKKSNNSIDESKLKSFRNNNNNDDNRSKVASFQTSKKEFDTENLSLRKFDSCNKYQNNRLSMKNESMSPKRVRRKLTKKKLVENLDMSKKLNIISQNIQGANKNINNPEEFYMDFFNDIIKKKTCDFKIEEKNVMKSETFKSSHNFGHDSKGKKHISRPAKNDKKTKYAENS